MGRTIIEAVQRVGIDLERQFRMVARTFRRDQFATMNRGICIILLSHEEDQRGIEAVGFARSTMRVI